MMHLLSDKVLEHFRCCKCSSVLSRGPIYSGSLRAPVCGRCVPNPRDIPNLPLEAFLRKYMFPCRYRNNGCEEVVPFNDKKHEEECKFKDADKSQFEIIDTSVWQDWKCCSCNNLLTVGPLSLNHEGNGVCGRCSGRWSELHVKETLVRNWKLEYIMKQLWLPCIHHDVGCERALKWGEVKEHEESCLHRPYSCPVTPYDTCKSVVRARDLYTHFEKEHSAFILTSPKFKESIDQDCDTHRIVRIGSHLFVLMSKIRVQENRMWFSAAFVGDAKRASKMKYVLRISNPEEMLHIPYRSETMQSSVILRMNENSATSMSLNGFRVFFRQRNLQEIICNVTLEEIAEVEENFMLLKHCKWNECRAFGSELSIKRHERETCPERLVKCKWDLCDLKISFRNIAKHENICDKKLILCKINNCKREYPRGEMKSHESKCEFRIVCCKGTDCGKQYPLNKMERHESECEECTINCRYQDCDVKCSVRNWNLHIRSCKHLFTEEFDCWVCYDLGRPDVKFFPPILTQHLLSEHPTDICEGPTWKRTIPKTKIDWIYFQYDGLLFHGYCYFSFDGLVAFKIELLAEDDLYSEYKYRFKLIHQRNSRKTITEEHKMKNYAYIWSDAVKPCIKDDSITIEWTIIKK